MNTKKIKIISNGMTYNASVCPNTNIATVNMYGFSYKFSKHEYILQG